ncbi:hypothetical protein DY124_06055 [Apilactobacillus micheneri]|uniref:hypothetical protein n=1 Tax=Apilactobacillus micheneri TaxID=1899430 RepID=UPI00112E4AE0|nr:hypothetical protein [Apilactobacillus micheneri]TPR43137.1 hypothetical protein DY124_06055 [Apilactobacillus micheneri]TPR47225.1 hypothetical protein DY125_06550 [Apilactobacillus micheneri]
MNNLLNWSPVILGVLGYFISRNQFDRDGYKMAAEERIKMRDEKIASLTQERDYWKNEFYKIKG